MIECVEHIYQTLFIWSRFSKVKYILVSDIEPIAEATERRPIAKVQANYIHVEIAEHIKHRAVCAKVVVIESGNGHGVI